MFGRGAGMVTLVSCDDDSTGPDAVILGRVRTQNRRRPRAPVDGPQVAGGVSMVAIRGPDRASAGGATGGPLRCASARAKTRI